MPDILPIRVQNILRRGKPTVRKYKTRRYKQNRLANESAIIRKMIHAYKLGGRNIILDIASGAVHSVDDAAYDVICVYEDMREHEPPAGSGELKTLAKRITRHIEKKHPKLSEQDVLMILVDIELLISKGELFTKDSFSDALDGGKIGGGMANSFAPIKALCLNVAHTCNMSCAYCFAKGGFENSTEQKLMPQETANKALEFLVSNSGGRKTLDIDFFGGEPLLNWQVCKDTVAYARRLEKETDKKFRFTLTTNGLLIDDDVISFANREFHNVVFSLDGRPDIHDKMRTVPGGGGSYGEILPKIKKFVKERREKGYYIRGTFTKENIDFSNDILHIADIGFGEISLEPVVTKHKNPLGFTMDDLTGLLGEYDKLALEMQRRKAIDKGFNFYHFMLDLTSGPCIHKRIAGCGVGTEYLAVTPNGELYPCHQFIGDDKMKMGDVWQGVTNRKLLSEFAVCGIYSKEECSCCWARFYCSGGCAANAYHDTGSISGIYKFGCELFKRRIENAIMLQVP